MKLDKINENWGDEGIQDPNQQPIITNAGYLMQLIKAGIQPHFRIHEANYTVDGVKAQVMDIKTGIFYDIIIKTN